MNNHAIARIFTRIADLMEIQGENPFKIRAYRNAAAAMQDLTESLEGLAERRELESIPGVGAAIAKKTYDILATGTTKLYEALRGEVPESLIELLELPGFGTRKIHTVWKELGVLNLDDLERAALEGRLKTLPGFAQKTEQSVLSSIAAHRRRRERTTILRALPYALDLRRTLLDTGTFAAVELAGSLRRMQETVGDINLAAEAVDGEAALECAAAHPETLEVEERTADQIAVITHSSLRATLSVAKPGQLGGLLQSVTGSSAHNSQLASYAAEVGRTLLTGCPDEASVYASVGLPWIPPELREGRGEIEAARDGRLPRLIEQSDIRGILHAHSTWSDGAATIERMAARARELGFAYHGNTDHSQALGLARGLNEERLLAQMEEIDRLNAGFSGEFRVIKGIECDILPDGTLDLPLELLKRLDLVIASVHSHRKLDRDAMTRRMVRALESGVVHILAHPTGRILGMRDPYELDLDRVMDAASANGVALEINASDRLDLSDEHAREAKKRGILLAINTDAHNPGVLGLLQFGIAAARRAWVEADDVINTWPLERLFGWLRRRG